MKSHPEELSRRLQGMEELAAESAGARDAKIYAGAVMLEVINPLEAINNLLYLLELPAQPETARLYVELAQAEVLKLNEITQRTLLFCKTDVS